VWLRPDRFGLNARLAILAALFFGEKLFLNSFVDFDRAQTARGLGAAVRFAQHWGFRSAVAFAAAATLFVYVRGGNEVRIVDAAWRAAPLRPRFALWHLLSLTVLAPLSYLLYRYTTTDLSLATVVLASGMVGVAAMLTAFLAAAPAAVWLESVRRLGVIWPYALLAAVVSAGAIQLTQMLWRPTAALCFKLVAMLLAPILPRLQTDAASLILSTDHFAVQVSDECSGLEGIGMILAFSSAWLIYFRHEYRFPRALLLIPIGVAAIFAMNVVRIAALVLIGNAGFPDVAIYGFHSQAGWIAFIAVACSLVLLSRRSAWLNRGASAEHATAEAHNPTAAYLMPLLAVLGAGVASRAVSPGFEYLYALRVAAGCALLLCYRRQLSAVDWRCSWRGIAVGAAVFVMWMVAARHLLAPGAMPLRLASMAPQARMLWIAGRIAGGVLIAPVVEELAYRGYLMRRLIDADFESVSYAAVRWPALLGAAVLFGCAHGALWLPGILTGLCFGAVVIRTGKLGEAMAGHATSNLLIAVSVLAYGQWQLW
jgi:exosortase E/protease (VPEID-CTERM system)